MGSGSDLGLSKSFIDLLNGLLDFLLLRIIKLTNFIGHYQPGCKAKTYHNMLKKNVLQEHLLGFNGFGMRDGRFTHPSGICADGLFDPCSRRRIFCNAALLVMQFQPPYLIDEA